MFLTPLGVKNIQIGFKMIFRGMTEVAPKATILTRLFLFQTLFFSEHGMNVSK